MLCLLSKLLSIKSFPYVAAFAATFFFAIIGVFAGPSDLSFHDTYNGLIRSDDGVATTVVWSIRIPRVILSVLVGASLGLSGVLIQLSARSPIGDPNLFGIGGGAVIFMAIVTAGLISIPAYAVFVGALASSLIVSLFLTALISNRNLTPVKFAIMGIAVGALMVSLGTSVISYGRVFPSQVIGLVAGSFSGSSWELIYFLTGSLFVCLVAAVGFSSRLLPITLGDDIAKSLGVNPIRTRVYLMSIAAGLAGSSVYAGGLIGFVALISPHIGRKLVGNSPKGLIFISVITGGLLTLLSDQLARLLFAPIELPVGLATTVLGAPLMMYLAWRFK